MADAAVEFLLQNVSQLLTYYSDLLVGVKETVAWIETEIRLMATLLLHEPPENAKDCVIETRKVILRAGGLIETCVKKASEARRAALIFKIYINSTDLVNLAMELETIRDEIVQVRQGWRNIRFQSLSQDSGFAANAMGKLDSALRLRDRIAQHSGVLGCIKWVRDELAPLQDFLREIDDVDRGQLVLGERQKIWIQELEDIFQFIDHSFPDFRAQSGTKGVKKWLPIKFYEVVSEVQDKILQLYRRYCAYGLGEILVDNGSRSIIPRIRMSTPIPDVRNPPVSGANCVLAYIISFFRTPPIRQRQRWRTMTYSSLLTPGGSIELFRVELMLMKALLDDASSMGDLDERAEVWLKQIQEIVVGLEALQNEHALQERKGVRRQLLGGRKIDGELRQIGYRIRDVAARKVTYDIGSALGEAGSIDSIVANSFEDEHRELTLLNARPRDSWLLLKESIISKAELTRVVESLRRELQLMRALFKDVNRMEKLDARLKVWVEEMLGLARDAEAALEVDCKSLHQRMQAATRIKRVYYHVHIMSTWKHAYDIGDVKSRCTDSVNHTLEEARPYPSAAVLERVELLGREVKLMEALYDDVKRMDELDGTAKAWVDEMHDLAGDATKFISPYSEVKDKIRQLSQIRMAYGIELRKRLPPFIVHDMKVKLLTDHENPCYIPILGMRHKHKEALQELINSDNAITRHFDCRAWLHVPEEFSTASISDHMVKQIVRQRKSHEFLEIGSASKAGATTEEELMQMLQEILMHKKYLIVLDEIQTTEFWRSLEQAFHRISAGSRIILITNEQTCSNLLNSSSNAKVDEPIKLREQNIGDKLPSYLKQCLFYFLLFPDGAKVPTRRLIVLWVAEGLVRAKRGEDESAESVAEGYLNGLIERGMVCVTKEKSGKVKACKLSDNIISDGWLMEDAKKAGFFQDSSAKLSRLVDHHSSSTHVDHHGASTDSFFIRISGNPNSSTSVRNYQNILSFLSFDTQEGSKPGEDIGNFLGKCISAGCFLELRVLDLEKVFRPKLPKALRMLILLKYLGLRWTYLETLPEYVNNFLNLEVLDVKHTYISILPTSIWRMQYLRHLYLSETYRTRFADPPSTFSLNELQTLWGAFIDENTQVNRGLDTAHNIRKLGLSCQSSSSQSNHMQNQLKAVSDWISNLEHLENLRLKSRDEDGKASELHFGEKPKAFDSLFAWRIAAICAVYIPRNSH